MKKIVMMVGLPGAGKSTYAQELVKITGFVYICPDEVRKVCYTDMGQDPLGFDEAFEPAIWRYVYDNVKRFMIKGRGIVYDATNLTKAGRRNIIEYANTYGYQVEAVVFNVSIETCIERQQLRDRKVKPEIIHAMLKSYIYPNVSEGIHTIIHK